ncbi:uncharacterized protein LY89DRAFT_640748 [Mollisia scopiformis]|uniref:Cytochrome c domain-containing protein n=1 Tax=Mollisia scopiformis TaxID=149040 RepID=A0A194XKV1_MOLSC|nr:uncharacterized protein LY89DRAFT_640748 [Mollisia scopiformis]KUJ20860.1 hypothetical protein LY89DRAFT_640748 [Mollisia scopiformis]
MHCAVIKDYCFEGNVNNGFVVQKNPIRDWYHASWMHWSDNGREPVNGLTFERPVPPFELSKTQGRYLQSWACGIIMLLVRATTFGKIWANPNDPKWQDVKFPLGTCVFKVLMTDATDSEIPCMKGSPAMQAVIAKQPLSPDGMPNGMERNAEASEVRLLQVDFAVRDDRAPIGWVFGTFMYDGSQKQKTGWDRMIPVGITWGNDPELTQEMAKAGIKPQEAWINLEVNSVRSSLGGTRPSWGWNGRLNGPVDNYISACASCHAVSEKNTHPSMVPPAGANDKQKMKWFRNIPAGAPFTPGDVSGDYWLQLMMGYSNYAIWNNAQKGMWYRTKLAIPFSKTRKEAGSLEAKRAPLRTGIRNNK